MVALWTSQIIIFPLSKPAARMADFTAENFMQVTCFIANRQSRLILLTYGSAKETELLFSYPTPLTHIVPSTDADAMSVSFILK